MMEPVQKARNAAAALLDRRMYTCQEVYRKLCQRGYEKEIARQVVEEFLEAGLLDDKQYAALYIEDQTRLGAKGMYRIRQELLQKGVSAEIIRQAAENAEVDTAACLREYVEQRNLCQSVHSRRDLEKLKARLARRGYSLGEINRCLEAYTFRFYEAEEDE